MYWQAESDDVIVASWHVPPERPEMHLPIVPDGAVRSTIALRWRDARRADLALGVQRPRDAGGGGRGDAAACSLGVEGPRLWRRGSEEAGEEAVVHVVDGPTDEAGLI